MASSATDNTKQVNHCYNEYWIRIHQSFGKLQQNHFSIRTFKLYLFFQSWDGFEYYVKLQQMHKK